jgi:hypothetical protein
MVRLISLRRLKMPGAISDRKNPFFRGPSGTVTGAKGITIAAEAANMIAVTVQLKDARGRNVAGKKRVKLWLSDNNTTGAHVATAPDGGFAIGGGFGQIVLATVASKEADILTDATGKIQLNITHAAGAKTLYVWGTAPDGSTFTSAAVTFA